MTLEDFEKELAASRVSEDKQTHSGKDREYLRDRRHHRHTDRERDASHDGENGHRSKRSRHSREHEDEQEGKHRHRHRHRHRSRRDDSLDDGNVKLNKKDVDSKGSPVSDLKRDAWMEAPSALNIEYVQRPRKEDPPPVTIGSLGMKHSLQVHKNELNHHLHDVQDEGAADAMTDQPAQHEVDYIFGDSGSQWRMTKLKAVYRKAEELRCKIEDVALERYDSLREFDDAREEEIEIGRRETYGDGYVGKVKPSGELFQERKLKAGVRRPPPTKQNEPDPAEPIQGLIIPTDLPFTNTNVVDQTTLNRMKAQLMKAKLRKDPKLPELEREYEEASAAATSKQQSTIITLSAMDNPLLSSTPRNEVKAVSNRRGLERGQVEENEDMSIEDMVREERRTKTQPGGSDGQRFAERIAKDAKFTTDHDYLDENADKLAKRVHQSATNIRNIAITDYQKTNRILATCPLCHHEDNPNNPGPIAPIISLGTLTYLTLPPSPSLTPDSALIVPTTHHTNLLHCDDDEWTEIRNFMKSLTRLYHSQNRSVIFYENAAHPSRHPHAALTAIPLPSSLADTAPAFFKEAFLSSEDEWSQHKKIINTLQRSKEGGLGKNAFRRSLVKEMPYFHVWFELDGGMGHVVEDEGRWPRGDLFAREVLGGMLGLDAEIVRRQGKWQRGSNMDGQLEGFRKGWRRFDWTRVLTEES